MKKHPWFVSRGYRHFDRQVGTPFADKVQGPAFVCSHSFSPLIHYVKVDKRYKPLLRKTTLKKRPIMFASHRDACVLSFYSWNLNRRLEEVYKSAGIGENVIAYRALGKGNYHFASDVYRHVIANAPVAILAYDVKGFFDNLDHSLLKARLKTVLEVGELPDDWFKVFRFMTRYHYIMLDDMRADEKLAGEMRKKSRDPIATIADIKKAGIPIHENPNAYGIPQGTPISATFSNLYMLDFDREMASFCRDAGALYRRYSDDILVVCQVAKAREAEIKIEALLDAEALEISKDKTEVVEFDPKMAAPVLPRSAQYLGFTFHQEGAAIRPSSLSRQWRKMRKGFRRTREAAVKAIASGKAKQAYTKKLRKRFTSVAARNFSSYARRSAKLFAGNEKILRQLRRFERAVESELRLLKDL